MLLLEKSIAMTYKVIAFDIDGTILNRWHRLPKKHIDVLERLHQEGMIIVPVTGRSLDGIPRELLKRGIVDYVISSNGAKVTNIQTQEDVYTNFMPSHLVKDILNRVSIFKVSIGIQADGLSYDNSHVQRLGRRILFWNEFEKTPIIHSLNQFLDERHHVEKIQIFAWSHEKLFKVKRMLSRFTGIRYPMSSNKYIEITKDDTDKGIALKALMAHLGIEMHSVCAIGDDTNDIPMLESAGFAMVMGNAAPRVKRYADVVVPSNKKDGFQRAIYEYLLKTELE